MDEPKIKTQLVKETLKAQTKYPPKCRYLFKLENEQPSGSFKLRGIGHLISKETQIAKQKGYESIHVYSSSGGNAGLAAAYASRYYGVPCTVVLPSTAKKSVITILQSYGAQVIVKGSHWGEADQHLQELVRAVDTKTYPVLCHPFDNQLIWEGHSSMIDELVDDLGAEDLAKVKGIICSVGGGGLYCGIVEGLERNGLRIPVIAVETSPAPTFTSALKAKKVVNLKSVNTVATSLASPYIAEQALKWYDIHPTHVELLEDKDAIAGTIDYYKLFDTVVEPACGATLAIAFSKSEVLKNLGNLKDDDIVIFIVCGGSVYTEKDIQLLIESQ